MGERNPRLDALRGVAILAMIVDHATVLVFGVERLAWNGRAVGRLAEPLFVVLFGYFLEHRSSDLPSRSAPGALGPSDAATRRRPLGRRAAQILLAAAIVEPLFYGVFVHLDILATLLLVLLLHAALGRAFVLCAPLFLLAPWDPTAAWLNYPLFLVASQAAAGALLRTRGGLAASALFLLAPLVEPTAAVVTPLLTLPAAAAVAYAARPAPRPGLAAPRALVGGLAAIGRRPLVWYAAHLLLLVAVGLLAGRLGGSRYVEIMLVHTYTAVIPLF